MDLRGRTRTILLSVVLCICGSTLLSHGATNREIDCEDEANREADACLGLLPEDAEITNFAPVIGPVIGGAAAAGLLSAGGSTISTTSTTSTTGTTN